MKAIVLLDTSVYLNVLDVPGFNQDRADILGEFETLIRSGDRFLLPLAAVWETGNHIADLADGQTRRRYAEALYIDVAKAFNGDVPYRATHFPERAEFLSWLSEFPDMAMRNKSERKQREGVSLADLSIIKEWERTCNLNSMSRVRIWSLDSDLAGYDRQA
ncbi:hypothetical protein KBW71_27125 [Hydrogenophaga aromaticivorans]|uniref:hypothetical protein n=1 Tax=Hydrogenophaga aromaticivorans TaxID=2610898 RepID=UPI001B38E540|nr:hypothetical protein [Hydrogenophaga aromaticivorans]MBQ0922122.1 hypothetical protein [Hydrogenophaga aromaticivorans]